MQWSSSVAAAAAELAAAETAAAGTGERKPSAAKTAQARQSRQPPAQAGSFSWDPHAANIAEQHQQPAYLSAREPTMQPATATAIAEAVAATPAKEFCESYIGRRGKGCMYSPGSSRISQMNGGPKTPSSQKHPFIRYNQCEFCHVR